MTTDDAIATDIRAVQQLQFVPKVLDVVTAVTGMGFATVARVTDDRWVACAVKDEIGFGLLPGGELEISTTLCDEVHHGGQAILIENVAEDAVYCNHPTPALYGLQSYISVPIYRPDGVFFGTLCAIDRKPAKVKRPEILAAFELFADMLGKYLGAEDSLASARAEIATFRHDAELREQFIAVLGHDLRNPLAAVDAGAKILAREGLEGKSAMVLVHMRKAIARMSGLIDNVLDFARGRLGEGIPAELNRHANLGVMLQSVADELQSAWPDNQVRLDLNVDKPVLCDSQRIGQLFSNLLSNALTHGGDAPIEASASTDDERLTISVANAGPAIPPEVSDQLFQPFKRRTEHSSANGLGLGLFIASEIARAHNGTLTCDSRPERTVFTFSMPLQPTVTKEA